MNILFVAINAKYAHTNLAVRYLTSACQSQGLNANFVEYTTNMHRADILQDICEHNPDVLLFSTYIWNVADVLAISENYKKISPQVTAILGGPEVSFCARELLHQCAWIDFIACGEGEISTPALLLALQNNLPTNIAGIATKNFADPAPAALIDMNDLPFPYPNLDLLQGRAVYYESSRGCPFGCSYCMSSTDRTTRFRSLKLVFEDLHKFIQQRVLRVKFVDRTFNVNPDRATAIWKFLAEHDNGVTCFHFEIGADLLTDEQTAFLNTVRPGLFQFEIGVQSTFEPTLEAVCRKTDMALLTHNVKRVQMGHNIHQHLDLIAGLPGENFERFGKSFDQVFAMGPQQLQLGFLKLLRGTSLYENKDKYGLVFDSHAPYEILKTDHISYQQLTKLKMVEEMCEAFYNSGRFTHQLNYLLTLVDSPFSLFLQLGKFYKQRQGNFKNPGKTEIFDVLYNFFETLGKGDRQIFSQCALFDLMLHEKIKKLPQYLSHLDLGANRSEFLQFLGDAALVQKYLPSYTNQDPKQLIKIVQLYQFDVDVPNGCGFAKTNYLFDYSGRTHQGHALHYKID